MKKVIAFLLAFIFIFGSFSVMSYADDKVDISHIPELERHKYVAVWIRHFTGLDKENYNNIIIDHNDLREVLFLYAEWKNDNYSYTIIEKNSEKYENALKLLKYKVSPESNNFNYMGRKFTLDSDNIPGPYKLGAMAYEDLENNRYLIIDNNKNIKVFTTEEYEDAIGLNEKNEYGYANMKKSRSVGDDTQFVTYKVRDSYPTPPDDAFYLSMYHWGDNNDYLDNYYFSGQEYWPAKYGGGQTPNIPEDPDDPTNPGNSGDPEPPVEQENNFLTTLAGIWGSITSFFQMIIQFFVNAFNTIAGFFG